MDSVRPSSFFFAKSEIFGCRASGCQALGSDSIVSRDGPGGAADTTNLALTGLFTTFIAGSFHTWLWHGVRSERSIMTFVLE